MSNYRNGYELERAARKDYEARGWFVVRAGGSKGPADLVALLAGEVPRLIQCKVDGKLSKAEAKALFELEDQAGGLAVVAFWSKDGRAARTVAFKEA